MASYSIVGENQSAADPGATVLGLTSATTVRPRVDHIIMSNFATPEESEFKWLVRRYTAAGSSTSVTPAALDPADPAAAAAGGHNHSTEPTYTAGKSLLQVGLHQKNTTMWYAHQGKELVLPATAANGVGISVEHASSTLLCLATLHHQE